MKLLAKDSNKARQHVNLSGLRSNTAVGGRGSSSKKLHRWLCEWYRMIISWVSNELGCCLALGRFHSHVPGPKPKGVYV